jgi:hypothetical protein
MLKRPNTYYFEFYLGLTILFLVLGIWATFQTLTAHVPHQAGDTSLKGASICLFYVSIIIYGSKVFLYRINYGIFADMRYREYVDTFIPAKRRNYARWAQWAIERGWIMSYMFKQMTAVSVLSWLTYSGCLLALVGCFYLIEWTKYWKYVAPLALYQFICLVHDLLLSSSFYMLILIMFVYLMDILIIASMLCMMFEYDYKRIDRAYDVFMVLSKVSIGLFCLY